MIPRSVRLELDVWGAIVVSSQVRTYYAPLKVTVGEMVLSETDTCCLLGLSRLLFRLEPKTPIVSELVPLRSILENHIVMFGYQGSGAKEREPSQPSGPDRPST